MKTIILLAVAIWSTNAVGQIPTYDANGLHSILVKTLERDTTLKLFDEQKHVHLNKTAYFLNGKSINKTLLSTLNPMLIEDLSVVKGEVQIDGILYDEMVQIKTGNNYAPRIVSLQQLKGRYNNQESKPTVFMIDGVIVNSDYENYFVDESYLLTVTIDQVKNAKENLDLTLIKLLTKSTENIRKSKGIRIRGAAMTLTK